MQVQRIANILKDCVPLAVDLNKTNIVSAPVFSSHNYGLEGYEVMRMTEPDIQEEIDWILDSLYWDEERQCIMQSITVQGGDTDQIPFMSDEEKECERPLTSW